jgi:pSer/pThr/pTyr-binding forkhead associated (FHA) protein
MDDSQRDAEAAGLPDSGPPAAPSGAPEAPADFVPLRLVLRPAGVAVELTRHDVLVGRHSEADLRLPLPDVSRRHCRFTFAEGRWHVRDLNSLNGTYLNDQPVGYAPVSQGDRVRVGGFTFEVDLSGASRHDAVLPAEGGVLLSISRLLQRPDPDSLSQRQAS